MVAALFGGTDAKPISGIEILPRGGESLHRSVDLMPSCFYTSKAGRSHLHCFPDAPRFLPIRLQPWQQLVRGPLGWKSLAGKKTEQAVSKRPKDECMCVLPNLHTGALVFLWDVMSLPYDTVCYPPCLELFTYHVWLMLCFLCRNMTFEEKNKPKDDKSLSLCPLAVVDIWRMASNLNSSHFSH